MTEAPAAVLPGVERHDGDAAAAAADPESGGVTAEEEPGDLGARRPPHRQALAVLLRLK